MLVATHVMLVIIISQNKVGLQFISANIGVMNNKVPVSERERKEDNCPPMFVESRADSF
jgi:hypothetical protein